MWLERDMIRCSGIEPPGCFNTGYAPSIVHKHYPELSLADVYVVGCEIDVRDHTVRFRAFRALLDGKRSIHGKDTFTGQRVYVYRTMQSARARYEQMCFAAIADRNKEIEKIQALRTKRDAGDLEAALTLGLDYGM